MKTYALQALELLERRRYARSNFLMEYLGGSRQNRNRNITYLHRTKQIRLLPPHGEDRAENAYPDFFFWIYEKRGAKEHRAFSLWHQVLIDDILISIETACKRAGLNFTDRDGVLKGRDMKLPATIEWNGKTHQTSIAPDAIFAIDNTYFVLEADRGTEPIERYEVKQVSYRRKILQYRDILKNKTYQKEWDIPNLIVLNITTKADRLGSFIELMKDLNIVSKSLCFAAYPTLASYLKSPKPLLSILEDPFLRAGHPPFIIGKEVIESGYAETTRPVE